MEKVVALYLGVVLLAVVAYGAIPDCPTKADLVQAIPVTSISFTRSSKDFDFDKSPAAKDRLNNTLQRLYINDRDGLFTYTVGPAVTLDFGKDVKVSQIATRGVVHHLGIGYIKTYKLFYKKSTDEGWRPLKTQGGAEIWTGNVDGSSTVTHAIPPTVARYFKLKSITEYHELQELGFPQSDGITGLRLKVLGCVPKEKVPECKTGFADLVKRIPTSSITVSTVPKDFNWDRSPAAKDRLNNTKERLYIDDRDGWFTYKVGPYVELDFGADTELKSIKTRGLVHHLGIGYIKKYKVLYKKSAGTTYETLRTSSGSEIWTGNTDGKTPVSHEFPAGFGARYIKIQSTEEYHELQELGFPQSDGVTGLRLEVVGCIPEPPKCETGYGDLVQEIALDKIHVTTVPKDFNWDRSPAAKDRLNNTKERLYINDRDGWFTYKVHPEVTFDFGQDTELKGLTTRGVVHHLGIGYIEKYQILYKKSAETEYSPLSPPGNAAYWTGNSDGKSEVSHDFPVGFEARYLKFKSLEEYHELEELGFPESDGITGLRIKVVGCLPKKRVVCPSNKWGDVVKAVPLSSITVSTVPKDFNWDRSPAAKDRLNNTKERLYIDDRDGWFTYKVKPYVIVDLGKDTELKEITTRGLVHHLGIGYIKKYQLLYQPDGESKYKNIRTSSGTLVFKGNDDGATPHTNKFQEIVKARYFKFQSVEEYHELQELGFPQSDGVTGLRMRVLGCLGETRPQCTPNTDVVKAIPLTSIKVSRNAKDFNFDKSPAAKDRLNNTVERLYINDRDGLHTYTVRPSFEFNLGKDTELTSITTRGLKHHLGQGYIKKYKILYKVKGDSSWKTLKNTQGSDIWVGNTESVKKVTHKFPANFKASDIKIQSVEEYHELEELGMPKEDGVTGLRVAIFGCY